MVQLKEALVTATETYPNVVLACLTNPLTNHPFEEYKTLVSHCNKTFAQILAWIQEGRGAVPGNFRQVGCLFPFILLMLNLIVHLYFDFHTPEFNQKSFLLIFGLTMTNALA
jgi:hypothetical protein